MSDADGRDPGEPEHRTADARPRRVPGFGPVPAWAVRRMGGPAAGRGGAVPNPAEHRPSPERPEPERSAAALPPRQEGGSNRAGAAGAGWGVEAAADPLAGSGAPPFPPRPLESGWAVEVDHTVPEGVPPWPYRVVAEPEPAADPDAARSAVASRPGGAEPDPCEWDAVDPGTRASPGTGPGPGLHEAGSHDARWDTDDALPPQQGADDLPTGLFHRVADRAGHRRRRSDDLGLRRALSDRLLPGLVAAMAFLAALALAGAVGAASLAARWQHGAASVLTVQVPDPVGPPVIGPPLTDPPVTGSPVTAPPTNATAASRAGATFPRPGAASSRAEAALALLSATPGVASARALGHEELSALLRPWLGAGADALSLPLPAVIEVRLADPPADGAALAARLAGAVPGTLVERNGAWMDRLSVLARSLQACAAAALLVVAGVAAAVVGVATRAGLSARRDAIEIVHGLGATDGYIAGRFAARATLLATAGAAGGALAALPVLLGMAVLAAPFGGAAAFPGPANALGATMAALPPALPSAAFLVSGALPGALPVALWAALPALPVIAAAIGWATAQVTVRRWLRRLP